MVATLAAYPLGFGLACRFAGRGVLPDSLLAMAYQPCLDMAFDAPAPIRAPLRWWVTVCDGDLGLLILCQPFEEEEFIRVMQTVSTLSPMEDLTDLEPDEDQPTDEPVP
jgi:hypothetical protein